MKTVLFERKGVVGILSGFQLIADSSITPPGRPVFMPDFASECMAEVYLAVKVSRLGKNIAAKFAARYFESFALALRLVPQADIAGVEILFDNALTLSEWVSVKDVPESVEMVVCGQSIRINSFREILDQAIVEASRFCTLKTGDILLPLRLGASIPIEIGTPVTATLGDQTLFSLKIK